MSCVQCYQCSDASFCYSCSAVGYFKQELALKQWLRSPILNDLNNLN